MLHRRRGTARPGWHSQAGIDGIEFVYFSDKDVVRHKLVQMIIKAYETHTKKSEM